MEKINNFKTKSLNLLTLEQYILFFRFLHVSAGFFAFQPII